MIKRFFPVQREFRRGQSCGVVLEDPPSLNAGSLLMFLRFAMESGLSTCVIVSTHATKESGSHGEPESLEMGYVTSPFAFECCRCCAQFEYGRFVAP